MKTQKSQKCNQTSGKCRLVCRAASLPVSGFLRLSRGDVSQTGRPVCFCFISIGASLNTWVSCPFVGLPAGCEGSVRISAAGQSARNHDWPLRILTAPEEGFSGERAVHSTTSFQALFTLSSGAKSPSTLRTWREKRLTFLLYLFPRCFYLFLLRPLPIPPRFPFSMTLDEYPLHQIRWKGAGIDCRHF